MSNTLIGFFLALSLAACASVTDDSSTAQPALLRIIVVPVPGAALDPAAETGISALSRSAGVPLLHLRSLGGGAHLLVTRERVGAAAAADILKRLAADPAVAMVEEDRRATHQAPGETR